MAVRVVATILIFGVLSAARLAEADDSAVAPEPEPRRLEGSRPIRGHDVQGYVSFTFDDGPDHRTTPQILDLLDEYGIKATFFVVGKRISGDGETPRKNREVLTDILARGHMIGNHTYGHIDLASVPTATALADIDKSQRAIEAHTGAGATLFRPPFGRLTTALRKALQKRSYVTIRWSIDPADTRIRKSDAIRKHVARDLKQKGGGIVLLHDTKKHSVKALRGILEDLEKENCRRLEAGSDPILPVELDWFARDEAGDPLAIPEDVAQRTEATRKRLETRCTPLDQTVPSD